MQSNSMPRLKMTAPCHFGLEKTLSFEIKKAGGTDIEVFDGRLSFYGDENTLARANLACSVAERIGIVLAEFPALDFDDVYYAVKKIPLYEFVDKYGKFPVVKGQSLKSRLTSIPALQKTVKKALAEGLSAHYHVERLPETGAVFPIRFFLFKDKMTVYLDTSGDGLHKRGYRALSGAAPIKETLAAGLIDLARVKRDSVIIDPFCGSGTILIEAAFKALNIAPCLSRSFIAEGWDVIKPDVWKSMREILRSEIISESNFRAYGFDNDADCVALSQGNAKKAGVSDYIIIGKQEIGEFKYPTGRVKIITNPPYGERLLEQREAEEVYKKMGQVLFPKGDNEVYVINANEAFEEYLGQKSTKNRKLYNGMMMCRYYYYTGNTIDS